MVNWRRNKGTFFEFNRIVRQEFCEVVSMVFCVPTLYSIGVESK